MFFKTLYEALVDLYCNKFRNKKIPTFKDFLEAYEASKLALEFIKRLKTEGVISGS